MNYDQFVQNAFEECFSPDLLKETSPEVNNQGGSPQDDQSSDISLVPTDSSGNCNSGSKGTGTFHKEPSDENNDDVFLPDVSKQDHPVNQIVMEDKLQKLVTLPETKIPNLSIVANPDVSPTLHSPGSPQVCTFTRGTVQRRSRIIYDDTAEFIIQTCSDSEVINRSIGDRSDCLDQKRISTMSITGSLFHDFETTLQKYQEKSPDSLYRDDTVTCKSTNSSCLVDGHIVNTLYPTSDTNDTSLHVISNTPCTHIHFSSTYVSDNSDDDLNECDILSVSCDDVNSGISGTDYESDASCELLKSTSQDEIVTNIKDNPEITSSIDLSSFDDRIQGQSSPKFVQKITNHLDDVIPKPTQTPTVSQTFELDDEFMKPEMMNTDVKQTAIHRGQIIIDSNNNKRLIPQLLEQHESIDIFQVCPEHNEKSISPEDAIKKESNNADSWMNVDDGVEVIDGDANTSNDHDSDDTSSTTSSSSVALSASSSDTVVEVPSFPGMPSINPSSSNTSPNLSPLKLEEIFDPSECQQFRSELVQRWQKNITEEDFCCEPRSPTYMSVQQIPKVNPWETRQLPAIVPGMVYGSKPYSKNIQNVSSITGGFTQRCLSSPHKEHSNIHEKRLSWPLSHQKASSGTKVFTENIHNKRRVDYKSHTQNGNHENGMTLDCGQKNVVPGLTVGPRLNLRPAQLFSKQVNNGLYLPSYSEIVYTSHLSQVTLSNQHQSNTITTSSPSSSVTNKLQSYHDHVISLKRSSSADSSSPHSPVGEGHLERRPPSYEDHVLRYGLPYKLSSIPAKESQQTDVSFQLCHAEPVQVTEDRTVSKPDHYQTTEIQSSSCCVETVRDGTPEIKFGIYSRVTGLDLKQGMPTTLPSVPKHYCSTWPNTAPSSSKTIQFHPTPPRRRKKLKRSNSENEESDLIKNKFLKGGKTWAMNSEKGQNIYLMLTL